MREISVYEKLRIINLFCFSIKLLPNFYKLRWVAVDPRDQRTGLDLSLIILNHVTVRLVLLSAIRSTIYRDHAAGTDCRLSYVSRGVYFSDNYWWLGEWKVFSYFLILFIQYFIYFFLKIIHFVQFSELNLKNYSFLRNQIYDLGKKLFSEKEGGVIFRENIHPCRVWLID